MIYNPIARKINKDMGTFLDSMDSDDPGKMLVQERDEFKKRVSGYIQNCKSVFLFGEYINTLLSPKPSEQPSSAPGPSDIAFWKKSSPPSQEEFDIT